jgi:hypothetical protein
MSVDLFHKQKKPGDWGLIEPEAFYLTRIIFPDLIDTLYSLVPIPLKKV